MTQYSMGVDPSTWPRPDEVDVIRQEEAFEKSADYADLAANIAKRDGRPIDEVVDELPSPGGRYGAEYDRSFIKWMDRQLG